MDEIPFWGSAIPSEEPNAPDVPDHLGGHYNYTNMDTETFDYLLDRFKFQTMLDVGCGTGGMLDYAISKGIPAWGVDGDPNLFSSNISTWDFLDGSYKAPFPIDFIWCVEFVEHVDEIASENFLETFRQAKTLFMTHALPQQGGKHHVNLQWSDYWMKRLDPFWECDKEATNQIRTFSRIIPYVKYSALVFTRRTPYDDLKFSSELKV